MFSYVFVFNGLQFNYTFVLNREGILRKGEIAQVICLNYEPFKMYFRRVTTLPGQPVAG